MDLTPYVEALRRSLGAAAAAGTEETRRTAELLTTALEPSVRLAFMDALSAAADEITAALADVTVDVRLRGFEPEVVVSAPMPPAEEEEEQAASPPDADEGQVRITLRLPETLKARVEDAAAKEGVSVNAWLVRAVSRGLATPSSKTRGQRSVTGYIRG